MINWRLTSENVISFVNTACVPASIGLVFIIGLRLQKYSNSINLVGMVSLLIILLITIVVARNLNLSNTNKLQIAALFNGVILGLLLPLLSTGSIYTQSFNTKVNFKAVIIAEPEYRSSYQRLVVQPVEIQSSVGQTNQENILVTTDVYQDFDLGDEVTISGKLEPIENFVGDTGREFNYQGYLAVRNIKSQVRFAQVIPNGQVHESLARLLSGLKRHYLSVLSRTLPEPHSSLAGGITVGANDALGDRNQELFRRVGLTHIIVLSGYNVAIVIIALGSILAFLPYWLSAMVSFAGIWLFVILVGVSTTIVRAGIMASIAVAARLYGSEVKPLAMLSAAIILMVLHNPLIVSNDPSFQLSVLATIGIISVTPIIEPYFKFVSVKLGLREIITTTLATQITVIPWIVYLIGDFSIVSPLANVLVLPVIPFAMAGALLIYVLSSLIPVLMIVAILITYGLLHYVFFISDTLGSWSLASLSLPPLSFAYITFLYALIGLLLYKLHLRNQVKNYYDIS